MRKVLLNLHLYTAMAAGIFLVILGVTGSIMAFEPELDHLFNPSLFKVQPAGQPVPVAGVLQSIQTAYPKQKMGGLFLPYSPDASYSTTIGRTQVFVNGYTGQIIGTRPLPTPLEQVHQMHLRLLMTGKAGEVGHTVVAIASGVLVWLVVSGLYLWWPLKRAKVKWGSSLRRVAFDLHNAVGIYTCVFLFVLAVTGIVIHFDGPTEEWLNKKAHATDPMRTAQSTPVPGAKPITPDQALATALAAVPGTKANILMSPAGKNGAYRVNLYFPEDLTGNRSWALVDQYSGKVIFAESSRTAVLGTRTIIQNRAIHTGQILGLPSKILMSLSSLMLVVMVITGYYMWWKKLRSNKAAEARVEAAIAAA